MTPERRVAQPTRDTRAAPRTAGTGSRASRTGHTETIRTEAPLILERYALTRRLGTGAFGTVWMARDERLEREVAVKILAREVIADGRFEREARAAARLSHPGIVTLYEAAVDDDGAYLVSELVRGETLGSLLAEGGLSDRDVLEIGVGLCDALAHAHEQGVVHRDVKPSNVLVPKSGRAHRTPCKLTDFGVARVIDADSLTLTGDVIGTLNYMAPEQAAGLEAGEAADLFSLALVLYEALCGVNPLRGETASRRSRQLVHLPPLRRQRRDLPSPMAQAIDRALRPRIEERGSLADLREGLAGAIEQVGEDPGVVTGAFERGPRAEDEDRGRATRLFAPRPTAPPPPAEPLPEGDPSRLVWQARALAGASAAGCAAWLDHRLIAPQATLAVPVALAALVAGCLTLLLPRIGWLALAAWACAAAAVAGAAGVAALLAIVALAPIVLLPAAPTLWAPSVLAPALGFVGLAGAWPAVAGWAHRPWRRMMLGAIGWLWVALGSELAGRALYERRPPGIVPRGQWRDSLTAVVNHVLVPLIHSGQLAGAAVWALAAVAVPWVVRRRSPLLDAARALVWGAALVIATPLAIQAVHGSPTGSRAPSAIAGAVAAVALALGPLAVDRVRSSLRAGAGVP